MRRRDCPGCKLREFVVSNVALRETHPAIGTAETNEFGHEHLFPLDMIEHFSRRTYNDHFPVPQLEDTRFAERFANAGEA